MEVRDLRIGNLVQSIISNFKLTVTGFVGDRVFYNGEPTSGVRPIDEIEPIPLSEEWLIKLDLQESHYSDRRNPRYDLPGRGYEIHISDDWMHGVYFEGNCMTYIKYVHQLQNLVYALTGQELTIKEPAV